MFDPIITVTAPASSYDLTTLATVKDELNLTGTSSDSNLSRWISAASSRFATACNRVFPVEALSEQIRLDRYGRGPDKLMLARFPIIAIASVTENNAATPLTAGTDYEADYATGLLYRLNGGSRTCWAACKIVVVYSAGYDPIPNDVADAVITLVRHRWFSSGRDPALKALTIDQVSTEQFWVGAVGDTGDLPPEVQAVVDRYRAIPV